MKISFTDSIHTCVKDYERKSVWVSVNTLRPHSQQPAMLNLLLGPQSVPHLTGPGGWSGRPVKIFFEEVVHYCTTRGGQPKD